MRALNVRHHALLSLVLACSQGDFTEVALTTLGPVNASNAESPTKETVPGHVQERGPQPSVASAAGAPVAPNVSESDQPHGSGVGSGPSKQGPNPPEQTVNTPVRPTLDPYLGLPETLEYETGKWSTEPAFPNLTFDDPIGMEQAPGTNTLYVVEREGRIYAFDNDARTEAKVLALDLSDVTQGEGDSGLLGIAFHPAFGLSGSPSLRSLRVHRDAHYWQAPVASAPIHLASGALYG
jgi:hypothetical protein